MKLFDMISTAAYFAGAVAFGAPGDLVLTLLPDTLPVASGGRCMDGSMSGYYYRKGAEDTYTIHIEGGGGCSSEGTCKAWAAKKGSSKDFARTSPGTHYGVAVSNCTSNPYFCNATAAVVPYCTGDHHGGNNTVASAATWGFIFDGHANFVAIIEELIRSRGLGDAKRVLLTGDSAGGIGAFLNIDWLAARLPGADVKGAPIAGWFFPSALPGDLPDVFPPSDYAHFSAGTHGNAESDSTAKGALTDLIDGRGVLNADCVAAQKLGEWWACGSVHKLYPYIKTSLYVIENMYDTAQIYAADGKLPKHPSKAEGQAMANRYVGMYGQAMRNSTAQVLLNASKTRKRVPDALFLPSCFQHPVDFSERITPAGNAGAGPQSWQLLLGDWFYERNQFQQFHRLVERCPTDLPCNTNPVCKFASGSGPSPPGPPGPRPSPSDCVAQLVKDGCDPEMGETRCGECGNQHQTDLKKAGCSSEFVREYCKGRAPPPPGPPAPTPMPGGHCAAQFAKDGCSGLPHKQCDSCVHKHQLDLFAAGCKSGEARALCTTARE